MRVNILLACLVLVLGMHGPLVGATENIQIDSVKLLQNYSEIELGASPTIVIADDKGLTGLKIQVHNSGAQCTPTGKLQFWVQKDEATIVLPHPLPPAPPMAFVSTPDTPFSIPTGESSFRAGDNEGVHLLPTGLNAQSISQLKPGLYALVISLGCANGTPDIKQYFFSVHDAPANEIQVNETDVLVLLLTGLVGGALLANPIDFRRAH